MLASFPQQAHSVAAAGPRVRLARCGADRQWQPRCRDGSY